MFDDSASQLWMQFVRISRQLVRAGHKLLAIHDLTPAQSLILGHLWEDDEIQQQDLANALGVTKGNISQTLKVMERKGLIERKADGTSKHAMLTEKSRQILDELIPAHNQLARAQFAVLSAEEMAQLKAILHEIEAALE